MSDKTIGNEASRLLAHPGITLEVERLQATHAKRHNITVDSLSAELEAARESAMTTGQISAAVSAIMGKAKLHGSSWTRCET
jgi:phage terminase small subunit